LLIRIAFMVHRAKDLSPDQRLAIESLLGRAIGDDEKISIRASAAPSPPDWLKRSWKTAQEHGVDCLSPEEIDAEIAAARNARHERRPAER